MGHYESTLEAQGLCNIPPLIQLPAPLFIGSICIRGISTHFGKVTRPDGVMLQLGQRSSKRDIWLWVPNGTDHTQSSPWINPLSLSHWKESKELNFITSPPPQDLHDQPPSAEFQRHFPPMSAEFQRHFPPMSAAGTRQHPQQGPLLDPAGGGGGGSGGDTGGEGGGSGGSARPSTGLLWPRRT